MRLAALVVCLLLLAPASTVAHVWLSGTEAKHQIRKDSPLDRPLHVYGCSRLGPQTVRCEVESRRCHYRARAIKHDNGDSHTDAYGIRCRD